MCVSVCVCDYLFQLIGGDQVRGAFRKINTHARTYREAAGITILIINTQMSVRERRTRWRWCCQHVAAAAPPRSNAFDFINSNQLQGPFCITATPAICSFSLVLLLRLPGSQFQGGFHETYYSCKIFYDLQQIVEQRKNKREKKRSEPIITQETLATATTTTSGLFREMAFEYQEQRQSCNGGTRDRYDPSETKRKKKGLNDSRRVTPKVANRNRRNGDDAATHTHI